MYLVDTDYLINLIRGDAGAVKFARKIDYEKIYVAISVVTVHEYFVGVYLSYWNDKNKLKKMLEKAESELARFDIIPYTDKIAKKSAEITAYLYKKGEPIGFADTIIAATAITNNLKLVTRNIKHFSKIPELEIVTY
ncbi:MAG: type II toxin-antitoxin system VapC family toxin [Thermoprotei archaeon]|nr:MAG: type II toxin-antitoxin system VapC family toxin [Thermoprotei archaeon]